VATAWLGRDPADERKGAASPEPAREVTEGLPWRALWTGAVPQAQSLDLGRVRIVEGLRLAMCAAGITVLVSLEYFEPWTWIPLVALTWALALAADLVERGRDRWQARLRVMLRRSVAAVLVFHYVCLAWIFFRAPTFDTALAVLEQLAKLETDHANAGPLVTMALAVGFAGHFFAEGSFRWLRARFVALPPWGQGIVLAAAALVLRELGHAKVVPFIYFQF
jgi:hypothetical protein